MAAGRANLAVASITDRASALCRCRRSSLANLQCTRKAAARSMSRVKSISRKQHLGAWAPVRGRNDEISLAQAIPLQCYSYAGYGRLLRTHALQKGRSEILRDGHADIKFGQHRADICPRTNPVAEGGTHGQDAAQLSSGACCAAYLSISLERGFLGKPCPLRFRPKIGHDS